MTDESRRGFIATSLCACATAGWAGWGVCRYLIPTASSSAKRPIDVGDAGELQSKGHLIVPFYGQTAIVIARQSGDLKAFNLRCTHAGCNVHWKPNEQQFVCPCHKGIFNADGGNVSGPPDKPLVIIPAAVRGGRIYLGGG